MRNTETYPISDEDFKKAHAIASALPNRNIFEEAFVNAGSHTRHDKYARKVALHVLSKYAK